MAEIKIVITDLDEDNVSVTLEGETGNPMKKDSPSLTNAQRVAWQALHFLSTNEGKVVSADIKKQEDQP